MSANGKSDLGIKPTVSVELRVPKLPGIPEQALVGMVQEIMAELQFWAPLEPPQKIADVACAVLGDVPHLQALRTKMAQAQPGHIVQAIITRPSLLELDKAEIELVLHAPVRVHETAGDTAALASFVTVVGLLTSPTARALLALGGKRLLIEGPFAPQPQESAPTH